MRSVLGATTIATILPMIDAYGAAVTYLLFTLIVWMSYGYVLFIPKIKTNGFADNDIWYTSVLSYIIKYGDEMRAGIDIGLFSAVEDDNSSKPPDST
jgi:hypothetical protein